jgi:hypothetical protein
MRLKTRETQQAHPERTVALIPSKEAMEQSAAGQIRPLAASAITKVRALLGSQIQTERATSDGIYIESEEASADTSGVQMHYEAIVGSDFNDPGATVRIVAAGKWALFGFMEEKSNLGIAESTISVGNVTEDGVQLPAGTVSLQTSSNNPDNGWVTLENPDSLTTTTSRGANEVPYGAAFDGQVAAIIADAQQLVSQLPDTRTQ